MDSSDRELRRIINDSTKAIFKDIQDGNITKLEKLNLKYIL